MSKVRPNPIFPNVLPNLSVAIGTLWRELAQIVDGKGELRENNTWERGNSATYSVLTSASASIAIDLDDSNNFMHTLTEDTTLAAPTHPRAGQAGVIEFTQHASSPKTLSFNSFWKWPGGTVGALTATNSAIDVMSYVIDSSGTYATCVMLSDVK